MNDNFIWHNEYLIGNETIDQQHKYLFDLANLILESKNTPILTKHFMSLYKYVREHFRDEEALMKKFRYPGYEDQAQAHEQMLTRLCEISSNIHAEKWTRDEIMDFMQGKFLAHILEMDSLLGDFFYRQNRS
jgi:hemerythrin